MPTLLTKSAGFDTEIRLRVPQILRSTLEERAKRVNLTVSEYARQLFLIATGSFDAEIERVTRIQPQAKLTAKAIQSAIRTVRSKRA